LWIATSIPSVRSIRDGQFVGNARWGILSSYAVDAQSNYWGDPLGPGGPLGNQSSLGDSVSNALVDASNFLTAAPVTLPPLAPPPPAPPAGGYVAAADRTAVVVDPAAEVGAVRDMFSAHAIRAQEREAFQLEHLRRREQLRERLEAQRDVARRDADEQRRLRRQRLDERLFRP
jgi:hypothetical protein